MGIISEQLKLINLQLGYAKESINNKYNIMDMPSITSLKVKEISSKIDDIPVLNTKDATALESDIIENKIAYNNAKRITGNIKNLDSNIINLDVLNINNLEFKTNNINGYISSNTKFKLDKAYLLNQLNITPNIIKKGETILGVQGEYDGLELTNDATAISSDIVKPKTAYVKQNKITGSLEDYRNKNINSTSSLNGNDINIKIPEGVYNNSSVIKISLDRIADLINLTPDKIKNGENVLGIIGNYTKPNNPEIIEPDTDTTANYVEYQTRKNFLHFDFKWGFWELAELPPDKNQFQMTQLYDRIYNTYYYNGECDGYYLEDNKDIIYSPTYNHSVIGKALSCYVYDLNLTPEQCNDVWRKVFYDCPELLIKFANYYFTTEDGKVKYLFFDSFDISTRNEYKNTCLSTFKEICKIIKDTYGITYKADLSSWNSYVAFDEYSSNERFKIAKVIHDYLVLNNVYGYTDIKHLDQIMYPALSKGTYTPVCASYSKAFQWCCQKFGIYTLSVIGYAGENHMWNMICYENYNTYIISAHNNSSVWNEVDVTWDDPSNVTKCRWDYFNVTTDYLKTNAGGNRVRGKIGITNYNNECYYDYISECSCTEYKYNGNIKYGGL